MHTRTSDGIPIGDGPHDKPARQSVMRHLGTIPGLLQTMRQAGGQGTFRVIMSSENAHLFKQGADGLFKPFLRDGGKFVENVNLAKVTPDYGRLATDLAAQVQMAAVMAKLDRIEQAIERVGADAQDARRNAVAGRIGALEVARNYNSVQERRTHMLMACNDATTALKVLAGQLNANIKAMPPETSGWFDGIFSDRRQDAQKAFDAVVADMATMAAGCKAVLAAYEELGEQAAAKVAFASFLNDIRAIDMECAARKARLVPGTKGRPPPETFVALFAESAKDLDGHLLSGQRGTKPLVVYMDIKPEDLEGQS